MKHSTFLQDTLNTHEVCKILGISRATLYRARKAGLLEPVRMGRFLRYDKSEIDKYIERLREENTSESVGA